MKHTGGGAVHYVGRGRHLFMRATGHLPRVLCWPTGIARTVNSLGLRPACYLLRVWFVSVHDRCSTGLVDSACMMRVVG